MNKTVGEFPASFAPDYLSNQVIFSCKLSLDCWNLASVMIAAQFVQKRWLLQFPGHSVRSFLWTFLNSSRKKTSQSVFV